MSPLLFVLVSQKPVHPAARLNVPLSELTKPVTAREAREAFARMYATYTRGVHIPMKPPSMVARDVPISRAEIVGEMGRAYRNAEPAIRFTPMPIAFDGSKLRIPSGARPWLVRLVSQGFVGKVAPLAVGPGTEISVKDFGDALGLFASRLAQLSHLPSAQWTPMLQSDR